MFASLPTTLVLLTALAAQRPPATTVIHPAVVRVIAQERHGTSCGSGALVAVGEKHGLVITNWHVVRDASGPILVVFPDGFRSGAKLLRTDRDWDLAALLIWRPRAKPIPLASHIPALGEPLTIAGYGTGWYRMSTGRVSQYVRPRGNLPPEMVQVTTPARHGDSGGPMLNTKGELAGVLFGTDRRQTTGAHCGPVHRFVAPFINDPRLRPVPDSTPAFEQIAAAPPTRSSTRPPTRLPPTQPPGKSKPILAQSNPPVGRPDTQWKAVASATPSSQRNPASPANPPQDAPPAASPAAPSSPVPVSNVLLDGSELNPFESLGVCFALAGGILLAVLAVRPLAKFE